jgi:hypothetical protein
MACCSPTVIDGLAGALGELAAALGAAAGDALDAPATLVPPAVPVPPDDAATAMTIIRTKPRNGNVKNVRNQWRRGQDLRLRTS